MEEDLLTALDSEDYMNKTLLFRIDDEATIAIPVITDDRPLQNHDETLVHSHDNKDIGNGKETTKKGQ